MNQQFLKDYFTGYADLAFDQAVWPKIADLAELAKTVANSGGKLILFGNGASASLAEHAALDFSKQGGVRAMTCHDAALMTAFANDFTYDRWMAEAINHFGDAPDAVILISVSGTSPSVVAAARCARDKGMLVVGFTGRDADNPLGKLSDIHFHVPSHAYNLVECVHGIWLTAAIDYVIGGAVYETRAYELDAD